MPEDCAGLVIRTLFSDLHRDTFRHPGFRPHALDVKDLLEAVRDGTVDAQDNSLTDIWNFRICDHRPQLTGHFFGAAAVLCHAPSFESWSGEARAAVVRIVDPSQEERHAFMDAVRPLIETRRERFGEELSGGI